MSLDPQTLGPLFELSRDAVLGVGPDSTIILANPAARTLLEARPGDPAEDILPAPVLSDPAERFLTSARIRGRSVNIAAVRTEGIALFTLTFPPEEQEALLPLRDRALRELGSDLLSARLAMDAIVKGAGAEEDEKLRMYTAVLYRSYYRVKRLQEHMTLALTLRQKTTPFTPRLTDLAQLCGALCDTVDPLVRSLGVRVLFETEEADCRVLADARLMETLLLNLLANSLLHAGEGDRIRVTLSRQEKRLILAVDDPGRGIAPERLAELFAGLPNADLTDTAAGAGLGLALVRGIAELHGGSLILESREGAGTRTRVWLPRPGPEELQTLRQPDTPYRADGLNAVLTELSVVLDRSWYRQASFD